MMTSPHIHKSALAALVDASELTKKEVSRIAQMSPQQLNDLISGRRPGRAEQIRVRLARALRVPVAAITCPCCLDDEE